MTGFKEPLINSWMNALCPKWPISVLWNLAIALLLRSTGKCQCRGDRMSMSGLTFHALNWTVRRSGILNHNPIHPKLIRGSLTVSLPACLSRFPVIAALNWKLSRSERRPLMGLNRLVVNRSVDTGEPYRVTWLVYRRILSVGKIIEAKLWTLNGLFSDSWLFWR